MSFLPSFKVAVSPDADVKTVLGDINSVVKELSPAFSASSVGNNGILVSYVTSTKAEGIEGKVLAVSGVSGKVDLVPK